MNTIQFKRSETSGLPSAANLEVGELALDFQNKIIYTKEPGGSVISLCCNGGTVGDSGSIQDGTDGVETVNGITIEIKGTGTNEAQVILTGGPLNVKTQFVINAFVNNMEIVQRRSDGTPSNTPVDVPLWMGNIVAIGDSINHRLHEGETADGSVWLQSLTTHIPDRATAHTVILTIKDILNPANIINSIRITFQDIP